MNRDPVPQPTRDPVRRALRPWIEDGWMPGAAWWVEGRDRVRSSGAIGAADPERGVPATLDTVWDLASLTKPFCTAALALLAHGRGAGDLDAPWDDRLPEFAGSPYARLTPSRVLAHRGGFPAWAPLYRHAGELLEKIARIPAVPDPDVEVYSDLGYLALGIWLERLEGRPLDEAFAERIAGPLGVPALGFAREPRRSAAPTEAGRTYETRLAARDAGEDPGERGAEKEVLRGIVHDGNAASLGGVAGHAGLFGTVAEAAAIVREWIDGSRLPWKSAAERRWRRASGGERTEGWVTAAGCGAARGVLPASALGHLGFTGTSAWFDPAAGEAWILLSNRVHPVVQERGFEPPRRAFHAAGAALAAGGAEPGGAD